MTVAEIADELRNTLEAAIAGDLTAESTEEQKRAGLGSLTAEEMARYSPITVDLTKGESGQYTVKPSLNREASPSSVIG